MSAPPSVRLDDHGDLLTVEEYAAVMRRGKRQAYEDVRLGRVPSIKLGSSIRIPREGIRRLLADALEATA